MNSFSEDAKDILTAASLSDAIGIYGASSGWAISIAREPEKPSTAITLYDTGSWGPPSPVLQEDYSSLQVRVRGAKQGYEDAYAKALAVREVLHAYHGTVNGTRYSAIFAMTDITHIGWDDQARPLLTTNYRAIRGLPTSDPR